MLRFIDVTHAYFGCDQDEELPMPDTGNLCAFLWTSDDTFIMNHENGSHIFNDLDEIREHPQHADRMLSLVPSGFFDVKDQVPLRAPGAAAMPGT